MTDCIYPVLKYPHFMIAHMCAQSFNESFGQVPCSVFELKRSKYIPCSKHTPHLLYGYFSLQEELTFSLTRKYNI